MFFICRTFFKVDSILEQVEAEHKKQMYRCVLYSSQGDHLSRKPGNVREFDSCEGIVREVSGKILSGKSSLKLFIVNCIFAFVLDFAELVHFILVSDHSLLHSYPHRPPLTITLVQAWITLNMGRSALNRREISWNCHRISHCLESASLCLLFVIVQCF